MQRFKFIVFLTMIMISCKQAPIQNKSETIIDASYLKHRLDELSNKMKIYVAKLPVDSTSIPRSIDKEGKIIGKTSRDWTSGFLPGTIWQLANHSKNPELIRSATTWSNFVEKEKWDTHTHDLGFKVNSAFGKWNLFQQSKRNDEIITQTAATLIKRFDPKIGAIKSWDWCKGKWDYPVIIDNMMNLEILFDATKKSGDSIYYNIAYKHALTTLKNHFRKDQSSYHVINFDTITGEVIHKHTHQGYSHESAWSRGQAWGLYGFAMAYDYTGDQRFLDQATSIANFFFTHSNLEADLIPYWDFNAPNIPDEPRDVSAAAVAANGLIKLAAHDKANRTKYYSWIDTILSSLDQEAYQTDKAPFLLGKSTGSVPDQFEVSKPISYGDYYYVEALLSRLQTLK